MILAATGIEGDKDHDIVDADDDVGTPMLELWSLCISFVDPCISLGFIHKGSSFWFFIAARP